MSNAAIAAAGVNTEASLGLAIRMAITATRAQGGVVVIAEVIGHAGCVPSHPRCPAGQASCRCTLNWGRSRIGR
ncbi:hypothetical protein NJB1604_15810 [Mycobacterium marinum]|nr:hypothetical protein NJB1604_15810 [Mycobacterium marinum]